MLEMWARPKVCVFFLNQQSYCTSFRLSSLFIIQSTTSVTIWGEAVRKCMLLCHCFSLIPIKAVILPWLQVWPFWTAINTFAWDVVGWQVVQTSSFRAYPDLESSDMYTRQEIVYGHAASRCSAMIGVLSLQAENVGVICLLICSSPTLAFTLNWSFWLLPCSLLLQISASGFVLSTASMSLHFRATSSPTSKRQWSDSLSASTRPTLSSNPETWAPSSVTSSSLS